MRSAQSTVCLDGFGAVIAGRGCARATPCGACKSQTASRETSARSLPVGAAVETRRFSNTGESSKKNIKTQQQKEDFDLTGN